MSSFSKLDKITLLLITFIFFISGLFYYLFTIDKEIEKYNFNHDEIVTLTLIDKDLDYFSLTLNKFDDYDIINKQLDTFEKKFVELQINITTNKKDKQLSTLLSQIQKKFLEKKENIEYFKSLNASLISGSHFLFDLQSTISENNELTFKSKNLVNKTLFFLLRYITSTYIPKKYVLEKLSELQHSNSETKNQLLNTFYTQSKVILQTTLELKTTAKVIQNSPLYNLLQQLHLLFDKENQHNLQIQKNIASLFFIVSIIILFIIIQMHFKALKTTKELAQAATVFENTEEAIIITDAAGKVTSINNAFTDIYGYSLKEIQGETLSILQSGMQDKSFYKNMWNQLIENGIWRGKLINQTKHGEKIPVWATIKQIKNTTDEIINYTAVQTDLRDIENSEAKVDYLAYHDALTGLYNRVNFEEYLKHALNVAKREKSIMAILFIDLDRFKVINDTLGHDIGDEVLVHTSTRLKNALRESDFISRWGGDEFVVIIENIPSNNHASIIANSIIQKIKEPININNHSLVLTASIGISLYPENAQDPSTLIKYADSAMYLAKEKGKNNFCYYTQELSQEIQNNLDIDLALHNALKNREFFMVFQPQYRLKNQTLQSVEALIRWENETLGKVPPDKFISIAEDNGTIIDIGYFVFEESCRAFKEMKEAGVDIEYIAINVSSLQFRETNIVENFLSIASKYELSPSEIEIEITERFIMEQTISNINILQVFREKGFKISIDDFGTGYSSMSYLKHLPVDSIKIDKSFVDDIEMESNDNTIIEAIIALSKKLHYQIVADGIETKEQEVFLNKSGCDLGQGYLFSRPITLDALIERFT